MREIDRLKWAIFCGYNPYKIFYSDCSGLHFRLFRQGELNE